MVREQGSSEFTINLTERDFNLLLHAISQWEGASKKDFSYSIRNANQSKIRVGAFNDNIQINKLLLTFDKWFSISASEAGHKEQSFQI